jgi:hypothetical protein
MRAVAATMTLLALVAGCPGALKDPSRFTAACPDVPSMILATRCATAACHSASARAGGLDLISPGLSRRLVGVTAHGGPGLLVDLLDPDGSVLVRKLTPTPPFGAQDPPGAPLDPAAIDCIRKWVRTLGVSDMSVED